MSNIYYDSFESFYKNYQEEEFLKEDIKDELRTKMEDYIVYGFKVNNDFFEKILDFNKVCKKDNEEYYQMDKSFIRNVYISKNGIEKFKKNQKELWIVYKYKSEENKYTSKLRLYGSKEEAIQSFRKGEAYTDILFYKIVYFSSLKPSQILDVDIRDSAEKLMDEFLDVHSGEYLHYNTPFCITGDFSYYIINDQKYIKTNMGLYLLDSEKEKLEEEWRYQFF